MTFKNSEEAETYALMVMASSSKRMMNACGIAILWVFGSLTFLLLYSDPKPYLMWIGVVMNVLLFALYLYMRKSHRHYLHLIKQMSPDAVGSDAEQ
jgi:hypothetical protein